MSSVILDIHDPERQASTVDERLGDSLHPITSSPVRVGSSVVPHLRSVDVSGSGTFTVLMTLRSSLPS